MVFNARLLCQYIRRYWTETKHRKTAAHYALCVMHKLCAARGSVVDCMQSYHSSVFSPRRLVKNNGEKKKSPKDSRLDSDSRPKDSDSTRTRPPKTRDSTRTPTPKTRDSTRTRALRLVGISAQQWQQHRVGQLHVLKWQRKKKKGKISCGLTG